MKKTVFVILFATILNFGYSQDSTKVKKVINQTFYASLSQSASVVGDLSTGVERVYTEMDGYRIFLHVIHKTSSNCLYHKHRWAAAFKQIFGAYEMGLAYSELEISSDEAHKLPDLCKFIINKGSYYEMTQTDALHYVKPLTDFSCSLMITKDFYPEAVFRKESVDIKLKELSENRKNEILSIFKEYL